MPAATPVAPTNFLADDTIAEILRIIVTQHELFQGVTTVYINMFGKPVVNVLETYREILVDLQTLNDKLQNNSNLGGKIRRSHIDAIRQKIGVSDILDKAAVLEKVAADWQFRGIKDPEFKSMVTKITNTITAFLDKIVSKETALNILGNRFTSLSLNERLKRLRPNFTDNNGFNEKFRAKEEPANTRTIENRVRNSTYDYIFSKIESDDSLKAKLQEKICVPASATPPQTVDESTPPQTPQNPTKPRINVPPERPTKPPRGNNGNGSNPGSPGSPGSFRRSRRGSRTRRNRRTRRRS